MKRFEAGSCEGCLKTESEVTFLGAPFPLSVELLDEQDGKMRANIVVGDRDFSSLACEKTTRVQ